jgi:hypothetical protein
MTPIRTYAIGAVLTLLLAGSQAQAAWDNVFQTCCFGCRRHASSHAPPPTVASASPCNCCETKYIQRCYYQPVTTYKTVCQPVTTYKTSYYCEPVCSYRSSCYYDPCTGQSIQVTIPVTTYRLRSKCDAVTSYVQRCVPVVSYRPCYYLEAVVSCAPPPPCPNPCGPGGAPGVTDPGTIDGSRIPPPGVSESQSFPGTGTIRPTPPPPRPIMPQAPTKLEHIVSRFRSGASVNGQVVANNSIVAVPGVKLLFVSRQTKDKQQTVTADNDGRFNVALAAGGWDIYTSRGEGMLEFHSSIDVKDRQDRNVRVVSR